MNYFFNDTLVAKLFTSFTDLEAAIASAKKTLESKMNVPESVIKRIGSYDGILAQQRRLAASLCDLISQQNWDEVTRHVNLINSLSEMIRDDAQSVLSSLAVIPSAPTIDSEKYYSC